MTEKDAEKDVAKDATKKETLLAKASSGELDEAEFTELSELVAGDEAGQAEVTSALDEGKANQAKTSTQDELRALCAKAVERCSIAKEALRRGDSVNTTANLILAVELLAAAVETAVG